MDHQETLATRDPWERRTMVDQVQKKNKKISHSSFICRRSLGDFNFWGTSHAHHHGPCAIALNWFLVVPGVLEKDRTTIRSCMFLSFLVHFAWLIRLPFLRCFKDLDRLIYRHFLVLVLYTGCADICSSLAFHLIHVSLLCHVTTWISFSSKWQRLLPSSALCYAATHHPMPRATGSEGLGMGMAPLTGTLSRWEWVKTFTIWLFNIAMENHHF